MNNSKIADERVLIGLDKHSLSYNYQLSRSTTEQRTSYDNSCVNKNYLNKSFKSFDLVHLNYKTIEFNMITCPAGGKVKLDKWGEQEIRDPFMLGETVVTQELFLAVMGFNYSEFKYSNKNPIEHVTWYDCLEFCNRLSDYFSLNHCYMLNNKNFTIKYYPLSIEKAEVTFIEGANGFRLPKEWEWQIAAMAGTNNQYAGASDDESLKRVAWFEYNSGKKAHPVAQKMPNEWGFYDMSGNVEEWCENSQESNENNDSYIYRVLRGGSWLNGVSLLRSANRARTSPGRRIGYIGFRVARSI